MWHAADLNMHAHHAKHYGLETTVEKVNWPMLKEKRDAYIARLDDIYLRNLEKDKVTSLFGHARFVGKNELEVTMLDGGSKRRFAADHICVAVGGHAVWPSFEGAELGITSDGFFELEDMPKKVVVVGAGYIAIEVRVKKVMVCCDRLARLTLDSVVLHLPARGRLQLIGRRDPPPHPSQ